MNAPLSSFRLVLWPSIVTMAISAARLVAELRGWVAPTSGGALHPLGITWCVFVFGAWFGLRLARAGSAPRVGKAWVWALLALVAAFGTAAYGFGPLREAAPSEETFAALRAAVLTTCAVAFPGALVMFVVWPRLAATLLLYGLLARATVVALTWLAKDQGWITHYTKFGPMGMERDMAGTMVSASVAQFGFWVPFTVIGGTLAGSLFARRAAR